MAIVQNPPQHPHRRQHVVITGASSGLGAALAGLYAARGDSLTLSGRNLDRLREVADDCRTLAAGLGEIAFDAADVTDADGMRAWLEAADGRRPIDVLYANAGLGGSRVVVGAQGEDAATAAEIVATNLGGVLNTVIPVVPAMMRRGSGHIVLLASLAAYTGLPQSPVYSATKAAVRVYGEGLRRMLRGSGVRLSVVSPGFVDTPMSRSLSARPPGVWPADKAARRIVAGVERGKAEIAFPAYLRLLLRLGGAMPSPVADALMRAASRVAERDQ